MITFGRFGYFSDAYEKSIKEMSLNSDNGIECELSYIPQNVRVGNVMRNVTSAEYNLCCYSDSYNSSKSINLKDIVVGYDQGHLYIKDTKSEKRLKVQMTNMLNQKLMPNIFRLLLDISESDYQLFGKFVWESYYENFTYVPEIRYENLVVGNEKWKFTNYSLKIGKKSSYEEFKNSLKILTEEMHIPNKVYYTVADNRLLLNIKEEKYIELLYKHHLYQRFSWA